jgi:hypothetical protein
VVVGISIYNWLCTGFLLANSPGGVKNIFPQNIFLRSPFFSTRKMVKNADNAENKKGFKTRASRIGKGARKDKHRLT